MLVSVLRVIRLVRLNIAGPLKIVISGFYIFFNEFCNLVNTSYKMKELIFRATYIHQIRSKYIFLYNYHLPLQSGRVSVPVLV